jgi:hypothetical protein
LEWCTFHGQVIESTSFVVHIKFTSDVSRKCWQLLNIYGPCAGDTREIFVQWMVNLEIPDDELWLLAGDLTSTDQKKTEIGRVGTYRICTFNNFINSHGLAEIPISGRAFTWSNMQERAPFWNK